MSPYPIIHINAFPGTGKLTIATHLLSLLPNKTKLIHNHLLVNPADAVLHRTQPGYQALRKRIRQAVITSLVAEPSTFSTAYILTDFQSSDPVGSAVCAEWAAAATARQCALVPIILTCDEEANVERLVSKERGLQRKLMDVEVLSMFRRGTEIHRFEGNPYMLELDVTSISAEEAARRIKEHLLSVCAELRDEEVGGGVEGIGVESKANE